MTRVTTIMLDLTFGWLLDYCTIQKDEGNCTAREAKWYYGSQLQRCQPFYYSGCNGNKNNFDTKDACEADCPNEVGKFAHSKKCKCPLYLVQFVTNIL